MAEPIIGFIGLGIMGKPMARNLLKAGYPLVIHNRSRAAVDELSKEGAQAGGEFARSRRDAAKSLSPCCRTRRTSNSSTPASTAFSPV